MSETPETLAPQGPASAAPAAENLADIVRELRHDADIVEERHYDDTWDGFEAAGIYRDIADRIEAAAERELEELVKSVEELRDGMCPHCDMQQLCAEGEDGMPTTCNAMANVNAFVARYKQWHEPNDGMPF